METFRYFQIVVSEQRSRNGINLSSVDNPVSSLNAMKLLFLFRQSVLAKRLLKYTAINWTRIGFCLQCYYSVVINIIIIVLVVGLECHLTQRRNNINITIISLFMCLSSSSSPHIRIIHKISLRDCVVFCGRQQIFHMNILVPL